MSIGPMVLFCLVLIVLVMCPSFPAFPTDVELLLSGNEDGSSEEFGAEDSILPIIKSERSFLGHRHLNKRSDTCSGQIMDTKILCERCAKYTKSYTLYTMCCSDSDDKVRKWCKNFIEYEFGVRN